MATIRFRLEHERKDLPAALTSDHNHLSLAGLVDRKATVAAVLFVIGRLHVAAEVCAINGDFAGYCSVGLLSGEGFADFLREHECRLVLDVKIAAELQCAMALRAVHEDGDRHKRVCSGSLRLAKIVPDVTLN